MSFSDIPRHKVFISYHHELDQDYKNSLIDDFVEIDPDHPYRFRSIFVDCSVRENDVDENGKSDEQIRKIIRDDYINDATVLIVLCGKETRKRKFVDWEIHAAMIDTEKHPKLGILVINLPSVQQSIYASESDDRQLITESEISWINLNTRKEIEDSFPYMPSRIIDNMESRNTSDDIIPITVVDWDVISSDLDKFKQLIDKAYKRARNKDKHYNYSAKLRRKNS